MNAVAKQEIMPSSIVTPMEMLDRAVASGASVETIDKLMTLQERWEKNEATKEFNAAIAAAKAEIRPIARNRNGHNNKRYADMASIANSVDAILTKHGLGYRYQSKQEEKINVTCVLYHRRGHNEQTSLSGPPDTTGSKNAVQAIGSTVTYLQRYTLMLALGLAASNDDDGATGGTDPITEKQTETLIDLSEAVGANRKLFCQFFGIEEVAQLPAKRYQEAVAMLEAKRKKGA